MVGATRAARVGIWIRAIALTMKKKKVPATASKAQGASHLADAGGADDEAEEGAEEDDHERSAGSRGPPSSGRATFPRPSSP